MCGKSRIANLKLQISKERSSPGHASSFSDFVLLLPRSEEEGEPANLGVSVFETERIASLL